MYSVYRQVDVMLTDFKLEVSFQLVISAPCHFIRYRCRSVLPLFISSTIPECSGVCGDTGTVQVCVVIQVICSPLYRTAIPCGTQSPLLPS